MKEASEDRIVKWCVEPVSRIRIREASYVLRWSGRAQQVHGDLYSQQRRQAPQRRKVHSAEVLLSTLARLPKFAVCFEASCGYGWLPDKLKPIFDSLRGIRAGFWRKPRVLRGCGRAGARFVVPQWLGETALL